MQDFLKHIISYYPISEETQLALFQICKTKDYKKNDLVLRTGDLAKYYYFVKKGLLGYYNLDETGNIKYSLKSILLLLPLHL